MLEKSREELYNSYSLAGRPSQGELHGRVCTMFGRKETHTQEPEGRKPLARPRRRLEDSIK
jgi:hypothetical protein